jgi:DNA-binding transcriptional MerR regulator
VKAKAKEEAKWRIKVGELATRTGVSVRALHHYDEIGLLRPRHTSSGHRIYDQADVERLLKIKALRQLGFSLEEIARTLNRRDFSLRDALSLRLTKLREEVASRQALLRRLEAVVRHIDTSKSLSTETIFETMEAMMNIESYFTPEQLDELRKHRTAMGEEALKKAHANWRALLGEVQMAMERGADPASPQVQELAVRWAELGRAFTGGNPDIAQAIRKMVFDESQPQATFDGIEGALIRDAGAFMAKAMASKKRS